MSAFFPAVVKISCIPKNSVKFRIQLCCEKLSGRENYNNWKFGIKIALIHENCGEQLKVILKVINQKMQKKSVGTRGHLLKSVEWLNPLHMHMSGQPVL